MSEKQSVTRDANELTEQLRALRARLGEFRRRL
jgi:hypothetical protein